MPHVNAWSEEEEEYLRENYEKLSLDEMSGVLGKSKPSITQKANRMGLRRFKKWTLDDIEFMKKNYHLLSNEEIAKSLRCSVTSVQDKARKMGLCFVNSWTEREDKYLRENYKQLSVGELAHFLNRTITAVQVRKKKLGLTNPGEFWTDKELSFLKSYYRTVSNNKISDLLFEQFGFKRSVDNIKGKAYKLGLSRHGYWADPCFFDTPNLTNCYYAGLIAADGNINDRLSQSTSSKRLRIQLHLLDKNILNEFIADTGFTGSLTITKNSYASLDVCCCQQWFESLESIFNITPRKCKTQLPTENGSILYPPVGLTLEQKTAFLIGLVDGDGSVLVTHRSNKYSCLTFFLCGSSPMMFWARSVIKELNLFDMEACLNVRFSSSVFSITTSGKKAEILCEYLMSINTPKMARKWVMAKAWLNKDEEIINAYINNRGKKMQAWKSVLKVFEKRGVEPEMYYYEQ